MKYSESTLRRKAYKIGYRLEKGYIHFLTKAYPVAIRECGYNVIDIMSGFPIWECRNDVYDHLFSMDDVEQFLREQYNELGLMF